MGGGGFPTFGIWALQSRAFVVLRPLVFLVFRLRPLCRTLMISQPPPQTSRRTRCSCGSFSSLLWILDQARNASITSATLAEGASGTRDCSSANSWNLSCAACLFALPSTRRVFTPPRVTIYHPMSLRNQILFNRPIPNLQSLSEKPKADRILFINQKEVDPRRQYLLEADAGLHPESDLVLTFRQYASVCLEQRDWRSLAELSRSDLRQQFALNPSDPVYVLPGITVIGFQDNGAFYCEAMRRSREWHRRLSRLLGNSRHRRLVRQSDWQTKILALHGALVVKGIIYLPGHWPNQDPNDTEAKPEGCEGPSVPPEFLGLIPESSSSSTR